MPWCEMNGLSPPPPQSTFVWNDLDRWEWMELGTSSTTLEEYQSYVSGAYSDYNIRSSNDIGMGYLQLNYFYDTNGIKRDVIKHPELPFEQSKQH